MYKDLKNSLSQEDCTNLKKYDTVTYKTILFKFHYVQHVVQMNVQKEIYTTSDI